MPETGAARSAKQERRVIDRLCALSRERQPDVSSLLPHAGQLAGFATLGDADVERFETSGLDVLILVGGEEALLCSNPEPPQDFWGVPAWATLRGLRAVALAVGRSSEEQNDIANDFDDPVPEFVPDR